MSYKENPKTKGSGIVCAIPQTGACPNKCEDCFFQSGRSYLEPLDENLPNIPDFGCQTSEQILRVNDGNDSNICREGVIQAVDYFPHKFYNTAIPKLDFDAPVVLTVNPGKMTDTCFHKVYSAVNSNLMFVRARVNVWNVTSRGEIFGDSLIDKIVEFYTDKRLISPTPVVLTFMAYHNEQDIPESCRQYYIKRKRTMNSYWAITTEHWRKIMRRYQDNKWVHSCGKIEGEHGDTHCRFCGNCLREYFATITRMKG